MFLENFKNNLEYSLEKSKTYQSLIDYLQAYLHDPYIFNEFLFFKFTRFKKHGALKVTFKICKLLELSLKLILNNIEKRTQLVLVEIVRFF